MNVNQYLQRINYTGLINPTIEVLKQLQYAHLMSVPFENLDIQNHIKIDLNNLFNKIVTKKRGGFCYELNGLFYQLLKEIGFTVKMVSARVYSGNNVYSREFDHMALIVKINNDDYLVDVGFGEFALHPIKIRLKKDTIDPEGIFRIGTFNKEYKVVKKKKAKEGFIPEYIFSEKERRIEEFNDMCNYHQTNKESHFMKKKICSLPVKNGRITLTGDTLKIAEKGEVKTRQLNEQQIEEALWYYFGIKL